MASCRWCKKSGLLLSVNRYGFCKSCSSAVRELIGQKLSQIGATARAADAAQDRQELQAMVPQLRSALGAIRELEQLRPSVPFFRSDTSEYAKSIVRGLDRAAGKAVSPSPPEEKGSAVEKAMARVLSAQTQVGRREKGGGQTKVQPLEFPLKAAGLVPAQLFGAVGFAPCSEQTEAGLPGGGVLLEQDPQSGDDPDTVRVYQGGRELGSLLPGPERQLVNRWLDGEKPVLARLSREKGSRELEICFYDQEKKSGFRFFPLELSDRARENLPKTAWWEPVTFRWEEEPGRYAVRGQEDRELGFLPQAAEALLEGEEPPAFLYQVQKRDGEVFAATVAIARPRRRRLG